MNITKSKHIPPDAAAPPAEPQGALLPAKLAAPEVGLSLPGFWKAVRQDRLPALVYPAARAPRWYCSELHAALAATRSAPRDAIAGRRAARIGAA